MWRFGCSGRARYFAEALIVNAVLTDNSAGSKVSIAGSIKAGLWLLLIASLPESSGGGIFGQRHADQQFLAFVTSNLRLEDGRAFLHDELLQLSTEPSVKATNVTNSSRL